MAGWERQTPAAFSSLKEAAGQVPPLGSLQKHWVQSQMSLH
jgi:hypothetical protein